MYSKADSTTSGLLFTKSENGNYTALTVNAGAGVPTEEFELTSSKAVFVRVSESNGTETYRLRDTSLADVTFTPKMSLTLDRDLVFNIYVPAKSLVKFTLDGTAYTELNAISNLIQTLGDGDYYRIQIPVAAKYATRDILLCATVDVGNGKTATATVYISTSTYTLTECVKPLPTPLTEQRKAASISDATTSGLSPRTTMRLQTLLLASGNTLSRQEITEIRL